MAHGLKPWRDFSWIGPGRGVRKYGQRPPSHPRHGPGGERVGASSSSDTGVGASTASSRPAIPRSEQGFGSHGGGASTASGRPATPRGPRKRAGPSPWFGPGRGVRKYGQRPPSHPRPGPGGEPGGSPPAQTRELAQVRQAAAQPFLGKSVGSGPTGAAQVRPTAAQPPHGGPRGWGPLPDSDRGGGGGSTASSRPATPTTDQEGSRGAPPPPLDAGVGASTACSRPAIPRSEHGDGHPGWRKYGQRPPSHPARPGGRAGALHPPPLREGAAQVRRSRPAPQL